jgi:hypothetical protein
VTPAHPNEENPPAGFPEILPIDSRRYEKNLGRKRTSYDHSWHTDVTALHGEAAASLSGADVAAPAVRVAAGAALRQAQREARGSAGRRRHLPAAAVTGRFAPGTSSSGTSPARGAAGSIGIMAVQFAALGSPSAIAVTTSSPERGKRLQELGATIVLDRSGDGGATLPIEFDVILDIIGGPAMPSFIDRLADNGRMVSVGVVVGHPPEAFGMNSCARSSDHARSRRSASTPWP